MVLHEGNVVTLLGLAAGLTLSYWATQLIDFFLFGIGFAAQMSVLTLAPVAMFGIASLAALGPALNAARVDPVEALRAE